MNGRCENDAFDQAVNVCDSCYGEFCTQCLIPKKGKRKPLCKQCAIAISGVRGGRAKIEPRGPRKTAKKRRAKLQAQTEVGREFQFFDEQDEQPVPVVASSEPADVEFGEVEGLDDLMADLEGAPGFEPLDRPDPSGEPSGPQAGPEIDDDHRPPAGQDGTEGRPRPADNAGPDSAIYQLSQLRSEGGAESPGDGRAAPVTMPDLSVSPFATGGSWNSDRKAMDTLDGMVADETDEPVPTTITGTSMVDQLQGGAAAGPSGDATVSEDGEDGEDGQSDPGDSRPAASRPAGPRRGPIRPPGHPAKAHPRRAPNPGPGPSKPAAAGDPLGRPIPAPGPGDASPAPAEATDREGRRKTDPRRPGGGKDDRRQPSTGRPNPRRMAAPGAPPEPVHPDD